MRHLLFSLSGSVIFLALVFGLLANTAGGQTPSRPATAPTADIVRVEALIDGRSQLELRVNTARWHHFDFAAPGRHAGRNEPTVINGLSWYPGWPDKPTPENNDCHCFSDVYTGVMAPVPTGNKVVTLTPVQITGTSKISLVQLPTPNNDFTLILEFNDNSVAGSQWVIVDITYADPAVYTADDHIVQRNFLGVNAVYQGFAFMPEQVSKGMSDTDRAREFDRVNQMGLNIARTWYRPDYTCSESWADCHWNAITGTRLYSMYLWLDKMKALNVDVALQAGWWLSDVQAGDWGEHKSFNAISFTLGITGYAKWVSRSISDVLVTRGYTNVKYLMMLTEPTQDSDDYWPLYTAAVKAVHRQLITDGLRLSVTLVGPNNSGGYQKMDPLGASHLLSATRDLSEALDIYSGHWYDQVYTGWNDLCTRMVMTVTATGKPVWLDEFGHWADMGHEEVVRGTGRYGNFIAQTVAACLNAGVQNVMLWELFDEKYVTPLDELSNTDSEDGWFNGVHRWGTCYWPHDSITTTDSLSGEVITSTDTTTCRPSWYALSLLSKYLGGREGTHVYTGTVYSTTPAVGVYLSGFKRSDGRWSFLVVNGNDFGQQVTVTLKPSFTPALTLYRYLYDPATRLPDLPSKLIGYDKSFPAVSGSFSDWLPAEGVVIYSEIKGQPEPQITPLRPTIMVTSSLNSGPGSLRWAIANLKPGGTITFAQDIRLIPLSSGGLVITKSMTINGPGDGQLILNALKHDRVFDIKPGAEVVLNGLTIANGAAHGLGYWPKLYACCWRLAREGGGGIRNAGVLTLTNSVLSGNEADYGGAIHNDGQGRLLISRSTFDRNSAAFDGGAIYNFGHGVVTLTAGTLITANQAVVGGGGILNWANGVVALIQVTVTNNTASYAGGGIYNGDHGTLTLDRTSISNNAVTLTYTPTLIDPGGAGIRNEDWGQITLIDSAVIGNQSASFGGGIHNGGGGPLTDHIGVITLTRSTLTGNTAANDGGGIFNGGGGQLKITESTIKANTAGGGGGLLNWGDGGGEISRSTVAFNSALLGGGIENGGSGVLTITNSTVSANSAASAGGGLVNYVTNTVGAVHINYSTIALNTAGSGLYNYGGGLVQLTASLLAGNGGGNCHGVISSGGYTIDGDGSCNIGLVADPRLGPLKDNGGSTLTHALLPGSPAIDRIPFSVNGCGTAITLDQRGVARPLDGNADGVAACDIGAYERSGAIYLPLVMRNH